MGSPITFSGFNNIDFNSILEALSAQERVPVRVLEDQQLALQQQRTAFGTLATRLSVVEAAARDLASMTAFSSVKASVSNESIARASVGAGASAGTYSLVVNQSGARTGHRHHRRHAGCRLHHRRRRRHVDDRRCDGGRVGRRHAEGPRPGDQRHAGRRRHRVGRPVRRRLPAGVDGQGDGRCQRLHRGQRAHGRHGNRILRHQRPGRA